MNFKRPPWVDNFIADVDVGHEGLLEQADGAATNGYLVNFHSVLDR
jgi:hypothetical protein